MLTHLCMHAVHGQRTFKKNAWHNDIHLAGVCLEQCFTPMCFDWAHLATTAVVGGDRQYVVQSRCYKGLFHLLDPRRVVRTLVVSDRINVPDEGSVSAFYS